MRYCKGRGDVKTLKSRKCTQTEGHELNGDDQPCRNNNTVYYSEGARWTINDRVQFNRPNTENEWGGKSKLS